MRMFGPFMARAVREKQEADIAMLKGLLESTQRVE
jgi:hypothetical protein